MKLFHEYDYIDTFCYYLLTDNTFKMVEYIKKEKEKQKDKFKMVLTRLFFLLSVYRYVPNNKRFFK